MFYSIMKKLHVSAYIGHRQVFFLPIKGVYISELGGVEEEISVRQVPNTLLSGVNKLYVNIITISNV